MDTLGASVAAFVSALVAVGSFIGGRRFIPVAGDTADEESAGKVLVALWLLAAIASPPASSFST